MSSLENLPIAASPVEAGVEDSVNSADSEQESLDTAPESIEADSTDQELTEKQNDYIDHYLRERLEELSPALEKAAFMVLNAQSANLNNLQYWQSEVAPLLKLSPGDISELIKFVELVISEREELNQEAEPEPANESIIEEVNQSMPEAESEDYEEIADAATSDVVSETPS